MSPFFTHALGRAWRGLRCLLREEDGPARRLGVLVPAGFFALLAALLVLALSWGAPGRFTVTGDDTDIARAIRLVGVIPDEGDDLLDAEGNAVGTLLGLSDRPARIWGLNEYRRTLVFEIPRAEEARIFEKFEVAWGIRERDSHAVAFWWIDTPPGRRLLVFTGWWPRTYPFCWPRTCPFASLNGLFRGKAPVEKVDVTLRFFYGPPRQPEVVFTGPFALAKTLQADGGKPYTITPEESASPRSARLRVSSKVSLDTLAPVLAYDAAGKRYDVEQQGRGWSGPLEGYYAVEGLPLERVAAVTLGEKPYERTFRNIRVHYPDRPARRYPEYLDRMAEALGLQHLRKEQLAGYDLESSTEAIRVVGIVRGRHICQAAQKILSGEPLVKVGSLDPETQEEIRRAAKTWVGAVSPAIRLCGFWVGLTWGQWPEFVDSALAQFDGAPTDIWPDVARALQQYNGPLASDQVRRVKEALLRLQERDVCKRLIGFLDRRDTPDTAQALWDLAKCDKPWLWMAAIPALERRKALGEPTEWSPEFKCRLWLALRPAVPQQ